MNMGRKRGPKRPEGQSPVMRYMTYAEVEGECRRLYALRGSATKWEISRRHAMRKVLGWEGLRKNWHERDWLSVTKEVRDRGHYRHLGDFIFQVGVSLSTFLSWRKKHPSFKEATEIGSQYVPDSHFTYYCKPITAPGIAKFEALRAELLEQGLDEIEANHRAADEVIGIAKHERRAAKGIVMLLTDTLDNSSDLK
jgi:hypothetical protein